MSTLTGVTLCSGGGGSALGLQAAGVQVVGAVESDAAIAAHYAAQIGPHVTIAPVQDVASRQWAGVDILQASPPCPNFSNAKQGGVETDTDLSIARAIVRALREIRPRVFWLENVEGYANSKSYGLIRAALDDLDYWSHAAVVNSADYGVPQTRRRLILRAVNGGWMQPFRPLPAPVPWVGWYAAVADLLDTLPRRALPPRQQHQVLPCPVLMDQLNMSNNAGVGTWRRAQAPAFTVSVYDTKHPAPRARLPNGTDVEMSPRALARFQAFPDSYDLPGNNQLACRILGNAVPPLLAQRITESLLLAEARAA